MQLQNSMQAALAKVADKPIQMSQNEIVWNFVKENPGSTSAQVANRFVKNQRLSMRISRILSELVSRQMLRAVKVANPKAGPGRKTVNAYSVTSDAFELLPNKSRKYTTKEGTSGVQPVAESQQPVTSDYMNKPVNSMTLQELRQLYGFLGKIFS